MNSERLWGLTLAVFYSVMVLYALFRLRGGILRSIKPKKIRPYSPPNSCKVLHETAETEKQVYGQIMSTSIALHIESCKIRHEGIKFDPPTQADNCLHEWGPLRRELSTNVETICVRCGTMRMWRGGVSVPVDTTPEDATDNCDHDWYDADQTTISGDHLLLCSRCGTSMWVPRVRVYREVNGSET